MDRILLFGGSFNPLHLGHLIIGRHVAEQLGVEQLTLVPSASPPHKIGQRLAPATDRLAMCRLLADDDSQFAVCDWEISQPGPNYTLNTIRHFRETHGAGAELYWIVGMDSLNELGTWHRARELVDACRIVTAARPGFECPDAAVLGRSFSPEQVTRLQQHVIMGPRIDIASTEIRARVRAGRSIRHLVPDVVARYIGEQGLYREA